jgi:hypothetical protein
MVAGDTILCKSLFSPKCSIENAVSGLFEVPLTATGAQLR